MVSVLGNAVLAFLESSEGGTLVDLRDFLVDAAFRRRFLATVGDPEVVAYWEREFTLLKGMPHAPVLTRLNTFLRAKLLRRMVGQRDNRLDFRKIIDEGKILLAKLSQGTIGEENSYLLGSLLVSKFAQAAMSRQNVDAGERQPYTLFIDEFHHFITPSIATILSGTRKYGLGLVLAHQETRQLKSRSEDVASSVLANAATRVVFRVGEHDAKTLAEGFSFFETKDLQSLAVGQAIARVEKADWDFNLSTAKLDAVHHATAEARRAAILASSRRRYAARQADIDASLDATRKSRFQTAESTLARSPDTKSKHATIEETLPGRGGPEHKYMQDLVRKLGEERGFSVSIEERVLGGHGHVDVALRKDGLTIGCEISMSTRATHEVANLAKLIAAGFDYAVLISAKERVRKAARKAVGEGASSRIRYVTPEEFVAFLEEIVRPARRHRPKPPEAMQATKPTGLISAAHAAAYLGLKPQTLAKMRLQGKSPAYHKIGSRVLYDVAELDAWIAARKLRSTSDSPRDK